MCPSLVLSILGVLAVTGYIEAINISTAQPQVTGYENAPNILAVSYQTSKRTDWLQIRWNIVHPKTLHLIICTIRSGDLATAKMFPENGYESRMTIDPESGSLIINHLKMEDDGIYNVSVLDNEQESWTLINVTVLPAQTEDGPQAVTVFGCIHHTLLHQDISAESPEEKGGPTPAAVHEGQCICYSNGSSASVPASAWILLSSHVSSIVITLLILFGIHFKNRNQPPRRTLRALPTNRRQW
ncbi:uncharacterized protein ACNLHF_006464 isoform 1-T1 [Anomaloglossus baeobatrachus]|uniref:uncharacterized protein LOC142268553 isoform X1 n=1 Tax=Anomaloglossus baeobatrachus TaxID=238106 RepID=UPI003F4F83FA